MELAARRIKVGPRAVCPFVGRSASPGSGAVAKGRRSSRKSAMTPPSNPARSYPHRAREARIGKRYTSHICARPRLVPLLLIRTEVSRHSGCIFEGWLLEERSDFFGAALQ